MNKLNLAPLPTIRADEEAAPRPPYTEDFVDDAVVRSIMAGPTVQRSQSVRNDLVLSADDNDFAGWHFNEPSPFRAMAEAPASPLRLAPARRAQPPTYQESGLGSPHTGSHRWWVAGLGGGITTLLLSYLLVTLAHRPMPQDSGTTPQLVSTSYEWEAKPKQQAAPAIEVTAASVGH